MHNKHAAIEKNTKQSKTNFKNFSKMNLFNKKPQFTAVSEPSATQAVKQSNKQQVIEQIHNEFLTAGDRLLSEAKDVLENLKCENEAKAKKLKDFGFHRQPLAIEHLNVESIKYLRGIQQESVLSFKARYPTHKWITAEVAQNICLKYNLILAEVNQYTGFVPEKNLNEIAAFFESYPEDRFQYVSMSSDERWITFYTEEDFYKQVKELNLTDRYGTGYFYDNDHQMRIRKRQALLNICAPLSDIELKKDQKVENNQLVSIYPDPVVLLRKWSPAGIDGYLILTAWGDEANDPLVVNENMN